MNHHVLLYKTPIPLNNAFNTANTNNSHRMTNEECNTTPYSVIIFEHSAKMKYRLLEYGQTNAQRILSWTRSTHAIILGAPTQKKLMKKLSDAL